MREVKPKGSNTRLLLTSLSYSLALAMIIAFFEIALSAFLSVAWIIVPLTIIIFIILKFRGN